MRYRSARTAPGVNPPTWIESDDASRPTRDEDGGRCAFRAIDGDATFVGSCDTDDRDSPHEGQNAPSPEAPRSMTDTESPRRDSMPRSISTRPPSESCYFAAFVDFPSAAVLKVLPSSDISHFQV